MPTIIAIVEGDSNEGPHVQRPDLDSTVDVSVLVPVRNEEAHLRATLDSMQSQEFPGSIEFIFADGCSTDGTRAILEECAAHDHRIRVLDNPRRRTPDGLNICLGAARGTFVARMDGHAEYPRDYLLRGVRRLERGDVVWVAGPQVPCGVGWWSSRVTLALESWLGRGGSRRWSPAISDSDEDDDGIPLTCGSGVFLGVWRKSTLEQMGGWDDRWPVNQDVELAGRFEEQGERIVLLSTMAAQYVPRNSPLSLWTQYFRYGYYRVKTSRRHPDALRISHLGTPAVVLLLMAACSPVRGVNRAGRVAAAGYVGILLSAAASVVHRKSLLDWVLVPSAFLVMHVSWGVGFWTGCLRLGLPARGVRALSRRLGLELRTRL